MNSLNAVDSCIRNEWHVVGTLKELALDRAKTTTLLGQPIALAKWRTDEVGVWHNDGRFHDGQLISKSEVGPMLPIVQRFGYIWTCLGEPGHELFEIPEIDEPARLTINACTVAIRTSAPRAIENFCDMAHFPFVHTGELGVEARPEVLPYDVALSIDRREILATNCRFFQPDEDDKNRGFEIGYKYRIPHPYCALLYKGALDQPGRRDVIGIFCQPVNNETTNAFLFGSVLNDTALYKVDVIGFRHYQLLLIGQDKRILENQRPRRLPLDTAAEIPARPDVMSVTYRRWLRERGVEYGTIKAKSTEPPTRGAEAPAAARPISSPRWYPVAASRELTSRHVFQTELLGEELAIWRGDDGILNVWENRCPHRGLRLTLGLNLGRELRCQYHGWRFASGSGRCTAIPANPALKLPTRVCVRVYVAEEKYGFVWTNLAHRGEMPDLPEFDNAPGLALRSIPFDVDAASLANALDGFAIPGDALGQDSVESAAVLHKVDDLSFRGEANGDPASRGVWLSIQPVDERRSMLHGSVAATNSTRRDQILHQCSDLFLALRRNLETGHSTGALADTRVREAPSMAR